MYELVAMSELKSLEKLQARNFRFQGFSTEGNWLTCALEKIAQEFYIFITAIRWLREDLLCFI